MVDIIVCKKHSFILDYKKQENVSIMELSDPGTSLNPIISFTLFPLLFINKRVVMKQTIVKDQGAWHASWSPMSPMKYGNKTQNTYGENSSKHSIITTGWVKFSIDPPSPESVLDFS